MIPLKKQARYIQYHKYLFKKMSDLVQGFIDNRFEYQYFTNCIVDKML